MLFCATWVRCVWYRSVISSYGEVWQTEIFPVNIWAIKVRVTQSTRVVSKWSKWFSWSSSRLHCPGCRSTAYSVWSNSAKTFYWMNKVHRTRTRISAGITIKYCPQHIPLNWNSILIFPFEFDSPETSDAIVHHFIVIWCFVSAFLSLFFYFISFDLNFIIHLHTCGYLLCNGILLWPSSSSLLPLPLSPLTPLLPLSTPMATNIRLRARTQWGISYFFWYLWPNGNVYYCRIRCFPVFFISFNIRIAVEQSKY